MDLNVFWFVTLGVLLTGYAILDGFDLGVGELHLFARGDDGRRTLMNSIGPVWDGNEVWLVTFGGALFAAFPIAYATAFSGFYLAFMLLLVALVFRAVAMEFRGKRQSRAWRSCWDVAFSLSSAVAALLFGVAAGNMLRGLPIGADTEFQGRFLDLLNPFSLLTGVMTLALFASHGAAYLYLKTEGDLQRAARGWFWRAWAAFVALYAAASVAAFSGAVPSSGKFAEYPWGWAVVALTIVAIANTARAMSKGAALSAFISSCCTIGGLVFLLAFALFPNLVPSTLDPARNSLTIYSAASSPKTLAIMRNIVFMGMPLVLIYTAAVYRVFRGKVKIGKYSY